MSIAQQCNLLKQLYQKKYFRLKAQQKNFTLKQEIKEKFTYFKKRKNHIHFSQPKKVSSLQNDKDIYNFQYCNQPIQLKLDSYRQFSSKKENRKAKSAVCSHQKINPSQRVCVNSIRNSNTPRQSHYLNLLLQHQNKINIQKSILNKKTAEIKHETFQPSYLQNKQKNYRNTITEIRRRAPRTASRKRSIHKTYEGKRDQQDLLPWNVDSQQLF